MICHHYENWLEFGKNSLLLIILPQLSVYNIFVINVRNMPYVKLPEIWSSELMDKVLYSTRDNKYS